MNLEQVMQQYWQAVRPHLDHLTDRLVAELRRIVELDEIPGIAKLKFEVEVQGFTRGFPVYWFALGEEENEVDTPLPNTLLAGIPYTIPEDIFHAKEYEEADIDTYEVSYDVLVPWFGECWQAANGDKCRYPAYLGQHDSRYSYDLRTMREIKSG